MPHSVDHLPVIDRADVTVALVEMVSTSGPEEQRSLAEATASRWHTGEFPEGLASLSCYVSSDGKSLLTYEQWAKVPSGDGVRSPGSVPFRLYRVVRGGAVADDSPAPSCFPAAIFPMPDEKASREWIDGLLEAEEEAEGKDREYPGAIAANFHVSLDGKSVLVLSEWESEKEAAEHIEEVILPLLRQAGGGDAGALYAHFRTVQKPVQEPARRAAQGPAA